MIENCISSDDKLERRYIAEQLDLMLSNSCSKQDVIDAIWNMPNQPVPERHMCWECIYAQNVRNYNSYHKTMMTCGFKPADKSKHSVNKYRNKRSRTCKNFVRSLDADYRLNHMKDDLQ